MSKQGKQGQSSASSQSSGSERLVSPFYVSVALENQGLFGGMEGGTDSVEGGEAKSLKTVH